MKNTNSPPRRCSLSMHWRTRADRVEAHYSRAHIIMDTLIKGGFSEAQAKTAVQDLWSSGRSEGYEDATYDSNDHD